MNTIANIPAPNMPLVGSEGDKFAEVDHLEGADCIKLKRDAHGQHHYIPTRWITKVDDKVHVDRPSQQAMRDWSTEPRSSIAEAQTETGSSL